jgi:vancomycin resistance protein VanW
MEKVALGATLFGLVAAGGTVLALAATPRDHVLAGFATSVDGRSRNQRHNALLALKHLDGIRIPAGGTFSFNAHVGGFNRDAGFRRAPVSYNGQLIDSWGGGVCQASTTTYNAALLAGMTILERHPHQFCPSYIIPGRDAAVSFGEIDLKFKNPYTFPVRLHAVMEGERLLVQFIGAGKIPSVGVSQDVSQMAYPGELRLGVPSASSKRRNSGKAGYDVVVYRTIGDERERVSKDSYPAMMRVIQYR